MRLRAVRTFILAPPPPALLLQTPAPPPGPRGSRLPGTSTKHPKAFQPFQEPMACTAPLGRSGKQVSGRQHQDLPSRPAHQAELPHRTLTMNDYTNLVYVKAEAAACPT